MNLIMQNRGAKLAWKMKKKIEKQNGTHLQHDCVLLVGVHQLEVLDTGHGHSAVEVEHVGAHLLVPSGRLVDEVIQVAQVAVLHAGEDRVVGVAVAAVVVVVSRGPAVVFPLYDATVLVQAYIVCNKDKFNQKSEEKSRLVAKAKTTKKL